MQIYQNSYAKGLTHRERLASFWVTMAGCGMSPWGPGTVGALLGAGLFVWAADLSLWIHCLIIVASFFLSVWAINDLQRNDGQVQDASWIVIDEGVGIWIALLGWNGSLHMLIAAFILFRLLDIFKPYPVSYFDQQGHSGLWVMMDDVAAGVIAWAILYGLDALRVFV